MKDIATILFREGDKKRVPLDLCLDVVVVVVRSPEADLEMMFSVSLLRFKLIETFNMNLGTNCSKVNANRNVSIGFNEIDDRIYSFTIFIIPSFSDSLLPSVIAFS